MGRIAKLLSFVRTTRNGANVSDVKVNPGGGGNITAEHFSSPGDDGHPLVTDYVALNTDAGTGREYASGYIDPLNAPVALPGDKRIYGRDSAGAAVVQVWLKNTGEAVLSNDNGSYTLAPSGTVTIETGPVTLVVATGGAITGSNGAGVFELQAGGDFVVNGVTIAANGDVTIPTSLTVNSKEMAEHTHSQADDSGGNTEQDTGVNN